MPLQSFAFGNDGHETIGYIAARLIKDTSAENEVKKILHLGETLATAAEWPDCAKGFEYCHAGLTQEMKDFDRKYDGSNKATHHFHFTDIPIQHDHYDLKSIGANKEDVVQVLTEAIRTLKGETRHTPHKFTKREALFLVAHLTGDIHQPLHVGAVYYGNKQWVDPASVDDIEQGKVTGTQGGNLLFIGSKNLHAMWDADFIKHAMKKNNAMTPEQFANTLIDKHLPESVQKGDVTTWPTQWADESLRLAQQELGGLKPNNIVLRTYDGKQEKGISIELSESYKTTAIDTDEKQIWVAGSRLAAILTAIWP